MLDKAVFIVNGVTIDDIVSYSVDSDLLLAADAFSFTCPGNDGAIAAGMTVEVIVNNTREMYGIIDRVESVVSKKGRSVQVQGRDLMGMLCSHDITEYGSSTDLGGKTIAQIAQAVIRDVPNVRYLQDVVFEGKAAGATVLYNTLKAEPGQSVFDLLKAAATGRGLQFWCREDGKLVFGKIAATGKIQYRFVLDKNGNSNVVEGKKIDDLTESFSKVFIYGQSEDADGDDSNIEATASMTVPGEFPFYKPKVVTVNTDKSSPAMEAKRLLNVARAKMLQLHYTVSGHSQNLSNYRTNAMARVDDEINGVHGDFIVCGRTFTLESKKTGPMTSVRLCRPGAFDA